jgi:hypothetical protein
LLSGPTSAFVVFGSGALSTKEPDIRSPRFMKAHRPDGRCCPEPHAIDGRLPTHNKCQIEMNASQTGLAQKGATQNA